MVLYYCKFYDVNFNKLVFRVRAHLHFYINNTSFGRYFIGCMFFFKFLKNRFSLFIFFDGGIEDSEKFHILQF